MRPTEASDHIHIRRLKNMGIVKGLAGINKQLQNNQGGGDRVKAKFLKLADGQSVKVRFLQELDADSPHYNADAGLGFVAIEHQSPADFRRRALCTMDEEGSCYGCEQYRAGEKGFRQKQKLYINALVTTPDGTKEVQVVSQGFGPKSVTPALIEAAGDYGSITNREFKLKRTGAGQTDTSYTLIPQDKDDTPYDVTQHELFDLEKVVFQVEPSKQQEYFDGGQLAAAGTGSSGSVGDAEVW